jgi:hypothetical protein
MIDNQQQRVNLAELLEVRSNGLSASEILTILASSCENLIRAANRRGLFTIEQIFLSGEGRIEVSESQFSYKEKLLFVQIQLIQIGDTPKQWIPPELLEQSQPFGHDTSDSHLVWCLGKSCAQVSIVIPPAQFLTQKECLYYLSSILFPGICCRPFRCGPLLFAQPYDCWSSPVAAFSAESAPNGAQSAQSSRLWPNARDCRRSLSGSAWRFGRIGKPKIFLLIFKWFRFLCQINDPFGDDIRFSSQRSSQLSIIPGPGAPEHRGLMKSNIPYFDFPSSNTERRDLEAYQQELTSEVESRLRRDFSLSRKHQMAKDLPLDEVRICHFP